MVSGTIAAKPVVFQPVAFPLAGAGLGLDELKDIDRPFPQVMQRLHTLGVCAVVNHGSSSTLPRPMNWPSGTCRQRQQPVPRIPLVARRLPPKREILRLRLELSGSFLSLMFLMSSSSNQGKVQTPVPLRDKDLCHRFGQPERSAEPCEGLRKVYARMSKTRRSLDPESKNPRIAESLRFVESSFLNLMAVLRSTFIALSRNSALRGFSESSSLRAQDVVPLCGGDGD